MKIGLLSDAHGNPEGLASCLALLQANGVDRCYFLGDAVGYFPGWVEVLQLLREHDVICLRGNHDERALSAILDERDTDAYQLLPSYLESISEYRQWMESWPLELSLSMDGYNFLFVHGSPAKPLSGYLYPWSDLSSLEKASADVIAMGHTHRPFVKEFSGKLVVNIGSCGLPRDIGSLSSCAVLDTQKRECVIHRTPFDVERLLSRPGFIHPDVRQCLERTAQEYVGVLTYPSLPLGKVIL